MAVPLIAIVALGASAVVGGVAGTVDTGGPNASLAVVIAALIGAAALLFTSRTMPAKIERLRLDFVELKTLVEGIATRAVEDRRQTDARITASHRTTDRRMSELRQETKESIDEVKRMLNRIDDRLRDGKP